MAQVIDDGRAGLRAELEALRARLPDYPVSYLYLLMGVAAIESADRTILATVFEDVKLEFGVGDSALGLLVAAYSIVGTLAAIPMGFLADRWNRVRLIAIGLVPWGIAMILTGGATSFAMMFAARLLLGTVEATQGPSTPSLIGDYWPVQRRSRLLGIYNIGTLVGTLLGFGVAGLLATLFSWRLAFVVWGGMGLLAASVVLRVLREPARGLPDAIEHLEGKLRAPDQAPTTEVVGSEATPGWDYRHLPIRQAIREVARIRTLWVLFLARGATEFLMSGLSTWAVSFFRRYHDLSAAGAGGVTALLAIGAVAGIVVGSRIGESMVKRGQPGRRIWLSAWSSVLTLVVIVPAFASGSLIVAVPFFLATGFLIGVPMAPLEAVAIDIVVPQLRGRASAVRAVLRVGVTASAPAVFGLLSDAYDLRVAILVLSPTVLLGGLATFAATRSYETDAAHAQSEALRQFTLQDEDIR